MRVLLDENLPAFFRRHFPKHTVESVIDLRWKGIRNGELLRRAEGQFDALLTTDQNLEFQHQITKFSFAVIVLRAHTIDFKILEPLMPRVVELLLSVKPGQAYHVDESGYWERRRDK